MTHLALLLLMGDDAYAAVSVFTFLSIGAVALFVIFLPAVTWIEARRKEREAYYRAETVRRVAESSGEGAKAAIEMLREDARLGRIKKLEGMKLGGLVNIGLGIALVIFLYFMPGSLHRFFLAGLIPGFMGLAMLIYVLFLTKPVE